MKFKTKEDLNREHGFHCVVEDCFKSFAERVEFYKKYSTDIWNSENPNKGWFLAKEDCPELVEEYNSGNKIEAWNDWLFDYCFGDVIK